MGRAVEVSDSLSNREEQIERVVKAIGRSKTRLAVFEAIYFHKSRVKSVQEIADRTGLTRMEVLKAGGHLARHGAVNQTKKEKDTAYEKIDAFHVSKPTILRYVKNPKKLESLPTKRKVSGIVVQKISLPKSAAKVSRIVVDDIDNFARIRKISTGKSLSADVSETQFKNGVQKVVGEPGTFKDWGGEKSDLYTTRLRVAGKRKAAAFAFKGPGLKGKLVPGRMGKNGDQMLRLFQEDADVYIVQHWREIDSSVIELMRNLAVAKSVMTGRRIWYSTVDGVDSERLRLAYSSKFSSKRRVPRR